MDTLIAKQITSDIKWSGDGYEKKKETDFSLTLARNKELVESN